ncbi:class I SAM-dependent methyltransferase [Spirosoma foliorum]|uniref:Class I SAM-dependent methyltransferase n=1 Tax=Spirosoma foliorum TaxID=2710596 RepID=A0A7G5GNA9_9BACT|nr:class I SAM-dependent methyltransferase [Spirosoma foliorum]QMW00351.1 class I SAM-dependent methyltransferase [Spirosoma foliorum]
MEALTYTPVSSLMKAEIKKLVHQGGPDVKDYQQVDNLMIRLSSQLQSGLLTDDELTSIRTEFGATLSNQTMQGFMLNKPHGYAGDFEIIERMYTWHISSDRQYTKWDLFLQNHAACRAVRNRKTYFKEIVKAYMQRHNRTEIRLLNLASGPCTELAEFIAENPSYRIIADCVDLDSKAIAYAKQKFATNSDDVRFIQKNVFRFMPDRQYDMIWSAGLFDYFNDRQFVQLISRFAQYLTPDGELIVGNFADNHPSKPYMDLVAWPLNYRNADRLLQLGQKAVGSLRTFQVGEEPERVNLFLHIGSLTDPA